MRVMLGANISLQDRFANGTFGRILFWSPDANTSSRGRWGTRRKASGTVRATHSDLMVFGKEDVQAVLKEFPDVACRRARPLPSVPPRARAACSSQPGPVR